MTTDAAVLTIAEAFERAHSEGRPALIPYAMSGYPNAEAAVEIAAAMVEAGADVLEIGMPFSDPLADGPTIQRAATVALEGGMDVAGSIDTVRQLRARGATVPIVLMGYLNPLLQYGLDRFCADAVAAGAHGLIVADLPHEEAGPLRAACALTGLELVPLVAPTTSDERIAQLATAGGGFVYCVSVTGVTGARGSLGDDVAAFLDRARAAASPLPTAVGFGISTPEHVRRAAPHADGVVFASALIDQLDAAAPAQRAAVAARFVREMRG
jgi:tryptophan synthase alpha chain